MVTGKHTEASYRCGQLGEVGQTAGSNNFRRSSGGGGDRSEFGRRSSLDQIMPVGGGQNHRVFGIDS